MDNQTPPPFNPPVNSLPIETPPVQNSIEQNPPQSNKSFLSSKIVLLIVILLILLGAGGTYLALNSKPKPAPIVSKVTPTSTPAPTPVDKTANWKTYSNTKYGFSFSYPQNLRTREEDHEFLGMQIYLEEDKKSTPSSIQAVLIIYNKQLGKTIDQDFDELYQIPTSASKIITNSVVGNIKLTKVGNRVVNGKKAFDYIRNSLPINLQNPEVGVGTYIDIGNSIVIIESSEENRSLLDQILSTFTFAPLSTSKFTQ